LAVSPGVPGFAWGSRAGFVGGLSFTARLGGGISFAPEALFAQKGTDIIYGGTTAGSFQANYLEVPLLFRARVAGGHRGHLFLTAGGQYSAKLNCKIAATTGSDLDCNDTFGANGGIKDYDYGAVFGVGVSAGRITLSGRYDLGLANLNKDDSSDASTVRSRSIMVLVGIATGR
jgi:hypothetical protein